MAARCLYIVLVFFISQTFVFDVFSKESQNVDSPNLSGMTVPFIKNEGQADKHIKYYAETFHGSVLITDQNQIVYTIHQDHKRAFVLKESLVKAKKSNIVGETKTSTRVNYFIGNDSSKWKTGIPSYEYVSLGEVYENIELKLKSVGNNVEKLFYVGAGANPEEIVVKVSGANDLKVNKDGQLHLTTDSGLINFSEPIAFQFEGDQKKFVEVSYITNKDKYGFKVGEYDKSKELVIDPVVAATFYGGNGNDDQILMGNAMLFDASGNIVIAGVTRSTNLPGIDAGSFDMNPNGSFVAKIAPNLDSIVEATYFGGSGGFDVARSMTSDSSGNIYIVGFTDSPDFPGVIAGTSADSTIEAGPSVREGFVIKFNPSINAVLAASYIGGSSTDFASGIGIDSSNNVFVAGSTFSADFPGIIVGTSADSTISLPPTSEGFVIKLDSNLSTIGGSTYLGGRDSEIDLHGVQFDSSGNVFVAGLTGSDDFPGIGSMSADSMFADRGFNVDEGFIAKLNTDLTSIIISTYLGGSGGIAGPSIPTLLIDSSNNVYYGGRADSADFPGVGPTSADSTLEGQGEAVVAKLDSNLGTIFSTFIGGNNFEEVHGLVLDGLGNIYVAGDTGSDVFPGITADSYDSSFVQTEGFVSKLSSDLTTLSTSTYLGGSLGNFGAEFAQTVLINSSGNVVVYGSTRSSDFPAVEPGALDDTVEGTETYLVILDPNLSAGVLCDGNVATIIGTEGNDVLFGTNGADVIQALGGNDFIIGRGGDDIICAGAGDDFVNGRRGSDMIFGEEGADFIIGSRDDDLLSGGDGFDFILGSSGDDVLDGGANFDICFGGSDIAGDSAIDCEISIGIP